MTADEKQAAAPGGGQPLFFERVTPVDSGRHGKWRLQPVDGYRFTATANALPVTLPELPKVCVEYPVVFLDEGRGAFPVAVVGLRPDQNLYLGARGRWESRYIPAYVRMYPFILARGEAQADTLTVCLDAAYAGFNEQEGEPLFTADGAQSEFLQRAVAFLREFHVQRERTVQATRALADAGLLAPMQAKVELRSGESLSLAGFLTVDNDKFNALSDAEKSALIGKGSLELVYLHRASLHVFDRMVDRLARREATARRDKANAEPETGGAGA